MQSPVAEAPVRPAIGVTIAAMPPPTPDVADRETILELDAVDCWYGSFRAVRTCRSTSRPAK